MLSLFDFERRHEPVLPTHHFVGRLTRSALTALTVVGASLALGIYGYHRFEGMSWIDSLANASMILSGMGPLGPLTTDAGKLFASFYALYSGIVLVFSTTVLLAPIVHRFFHSFHVGEDEKEP